MKSLINRILIGFAFTVLCSIGVCQQDFLNVGSYEAVFSRDSYRQVASHELFKLEDIYLIDDVTVRAWAGVNLSNDEALTSGFSITKDFTLSKNGSLTGFAGFAFAAFEPGRKPFSDSGLHLGLIWAW